MTHQIVWSSPGTPWGQGGDLQDCLKVSLSDLPKSCLGTGLFEGVNDTSAVGISACPAVTSPCPKIWPRGANGVDGDLSASPPSTDSLGAGDRFRLK